ncbi:hypothetical protein FRC11_010479, partial [Ceratobasidium sp. 423]
LGPRPTTLLYPSPSPCPALPNPLSSSLYITSLYDPSFLGPGDHLAIIQASF